MWPSSTVFWTEFYCRHGLHSTYTYHRRHFLGNDSDRRPLTLETFLALGNKCYVIRARLGVPVCSPHQPCFWRLPPPPSSHSAPSPQCRASHCCGLCDDDHCIRHALTRPAHCFRFRFGRKKMLNSLGRTCPVAPHGRDKDGMIVHHLLVLHFHSPAPCRCQADHRTSNLSSSRNCNNPRTRRFASAQTFAHAHVSLPTLTWPDLFGPEKWTLTDSDSVADAAGRTPSGGAELSPLLGLARAAGSSSVGLSLLAPSGSST